MPEPRRRKVSGSPVVCRVRAVAAIGAPRPRRLEARHAAAEAERKQEERRIMRQRQQAAERAARLELTEEWTEVLGQVIAEERQNARPRRRAARIAPRRVDRAAHRRARPDPRPAGVAVEEAQQCGLTCSRPARICAWPSCGCSPPTFELSRHRRARLAPTIPPHPVLPARCGIPPSPSARPCSPFARPGGDGRS